MNDWINAIHIITALLMLAADCLGSPQSAAAVAVARAALDIADEQPDLPDNNEQIRRSENSSRPSVDREEKRIETASEIKLVIDSLGEPISEIPRAQLIVKHWESGCPACDRLDRDIRKRLIPLGWSYGIGESNQIRSVTVTQTEAVPQIVLVKNGVVVERWQGYQDPGMLSNHLLAAWESASDPQPQVMQSGPAGAIHARSQIEQVFQWWSKNFGEGTKVEFDWDRTGAQQFPLLAKGDWSTLALFGKSGRFEVSANGSKLPIESLGFSYLVRGDDIVVDADAITFKGLATRLVPNSSGVMSAEPSPVPSTFGPGTILTIASVARGIWSLLHPHADLQLGGNVSATAVLENDMLAIDFEQCPSIKLVALFTFQLAVKRVEITEQSVRMVFNGSRLVKERTFRVE